MSAHPLIPQAGVNLAGILTVAVASGEPIPAETLEQITELAGELEANGDVDQRLPSLLRSLLARVGNVGS